MRVRAVLARALLTAGLLAGMGTAGMSAGTAAGASPSDAPTALTGTFFNCTNGQSGMFVINSGKATATTWTAAHLTFTSSGTGIFVSTAQDIIFTSPGGTSTEHVTKGKASGSVTCSISATPAPSFSLTGTVTGNIIRSE